MKPYYYRSSNEFYVKYSETVHIYPVYIAISILPSGLGRKPYHIIHWKLVCCFGQKKNWKKLNANKTTEKQINWRMKCVGLKSNGYDRCRRQDSRCKHVNVATTLLIIILTNQYGVIQAMLCLRAERMAKLTATYVIFSCFRFFLSTSLRIFHFDSQQKETNTLNWQCEFKHRWNNKATGQLQLYSSSEMFLYAYLNDFAKMSVVCTLRMQSSFFFQWIRWLLWFGIAVDCSNFSIDHSILCIVYTKFRA